MGSIIASPALERKLREEHFLAQKLLKLDPLTDQEKEMLDQTAWDQNMKLWMSLVVGFSFGASLKRYFPEAFFVSSTPLFIATMVSIMFPCFCLANVYTNREVIQQLHHLEEVHRRATLMKRRYNREQKNS